jgi:quinoprotein glucose dehydrogenase
MHRRTFALLLSFFIGLTAFLAAEEPSRTYKPNVRPASDEGKKALGRIRVAKGHQIDLFAAEPLLANPVCFAIDNKNRFFVAETFRLHAGVTDIRNHMDWLNEDLASRTVADRIALHKKYEAGRMAGYANNTERVRLIEDTKGTGTADKSTVYAEGFANIEDGIGAGLLARGKDVWFTCIPDLWLLRDAKSTGHADEKKKLATGFGIHVGYLGHDLHGLIMGPDGRIYFSIGDRGLNVKTKDSELVYLDHGSVLRCNPDGSELEVYATGLRNPQELAFDRYGNLFTCDNNCDAGDAARWVNIVAGGDSGWRIGYQFDCPMGVRGPWMAEKLWHLPSPDQAAYLLPPLAHITSGPSGLAAYPGMGLADRYDDHFFLCDFRGGAGGSGVWSFGVKPKGASFELVDREQFAWSVLATDCDFGTDCALYISDWVDGWGLTGKGRIYKVSDPEKAKSQEVRNVKNILSAGMEGRSENELIRFLGHKHARIRQETQFALAAKGKPAVELFTRVVRDSKEQLARLHAIWGLWQLGRTEESARKALLPFAGDADPIVRGQTAHVLGDLRVADAQDALIKLLRDAEPRVRFEAALAVGRLGKSTSVAAVLGLVKENDDRDGYLRHAGVMALAGCADDKTLAALATDTSPAVRRSALLGLRRHASPEIAVFLKDSDPSIILEAARAINDVPINAAMPALAELIHSTKLPLFLGYRVLNAQFRLGKSENALAIARFAARSEEAEALRIDAVKMLTEWAKPNGRDRIVGLWRPLSERPAMDAADALKRSLAGIMNGPAKLRSEAAKAVGNLGIKEFGPALFAQLSDAKQNGDLRAEALRTLEALDYRELDKAVAVSLSDADARLRAEGLAVLARRKPEVALPRLEQALQKGEPVEKQSAFTALGTIKDNASAGILTRALEDLKSGKITPEAHLDLLEAAKSRPEKSVKEALAKYEAARPKGDHLAAYRETLEGGDAENGRRLFQTKSEVYCLRCHKVGGTGGDVGPDLSGIGSRQKREYLLESIVEPNRQIAKGFETVLVTTTRGQVLSGVFKSEDAKELRLVTPEGKPLVIPKIEIEERTAGKSAMPEDMVKHLTKRELRDIVAFLAGLKETKK